MHVHLSQSHGNAIFRLNLVNGEALDTKSKTELFVERFAACHPKTQGLLKKHQVFRAFGAQHHGVFFFNSSASVLLLTLIP